LLHTRTPKAKWSHVGGFVYQKDNGGGRTENKISIEKVEVEIFNCYVSFQREKGRHYGSYHD
jgi:hypothetical protein